MMLCFSHYSNIAQNLENDVPRSQLDIYRRKIVGLEEYGFDVRDLLSRIDEALSIKERQANILEEQNVFEKNMTDESGKEPKLNKSSSTM